MVKTIKFKGLTGRFQTPSFLYTENETLTLKFDIHEHRVGKYVVVVECGEQRKERTLGKEMTMDIPPEFIKAGEYNPLHIFLEFRNTLADKVIIKNNPAEGGFFVEPLYVDRVSGNTTFLAWATKIEKELAELKAKQDKIDERLKAFEDEGVPLV